MEIGLEEIEAFASAKRGKEECVGTVLVWPDPEPVTGESNTAFEKATPRTARRERTAIGTSQEETHVPDI
ncbi:MAG: hypothetical protein EXR45_06635 [Chloroflexi bacterium]|nr:hypothetical protein [Chloroflexota bacterium]